MKHRQTPPACPRCGSSDQQIPIVYGLPGSKLIEASRRNEVILGGCVVQSDNPRWFCRSCDGGHKPRASLARGALLGLAVGDAIGTTLEFSPPGSFEPVTDMVGGGPFRLEPGEWTDDTSMALCLAESLAVCGQFDAVDQLERYVRWFRHGHLSSTGSCFDIGNTIAASLCRFEASGAPYCGSTDPQTAGNGSIMRLAPVAIAYKSADEAVEYCGRSSRTTHQAETAVDGCRYLGALLHGALESCGKDDLLSGRFEPVPGLWRNQPLCREIDAVACGSFRRKEPPEIRGSGYVVDSLEAALWAFERSDSFAETVLRAANLGDDADTTAAVAGQLAGAYWGEAGIPERWLGQLAMRQTITRFADALVELRL